MKLELDLIIDKKLWNTHTWTTKGYSGGKVKPFCARVIKEVLKYFKFNNALQITVSIMLSDNNFLKSLNLQYRQKDSPTNVLSFTYADKDEVFKHCGSIDDGKEYEDQEFYLGDLAFSYEKLLEESADFGIELSDYFAHLLIHGMVHLFGFDHELSQDAALEMEKIEGEILKNLDIANPYL